MRIVLRLLLMGSGLSLACFGQYFEVLDVAFRIGMTRQEAMELSKKTGLRLQTGPNSELVLVSPGEKRVVYCSMGFGAEDRLNHIRKFVRAFDPGDDPMDLMQAVFTVLDNAQRANRQHGSVETLVTRTPELTMESVRIWYGSSYYQLSREYGFGKHQAQRGIVLYEGLMVK